MDDWNTFNFDDLNWLDNQTFKKKVLILQVKIQMKSILSKHKMQAFSDDLNSLRNF